MTSMNSIRTLRRAYTTPLLWGCAMMCFFLQSLQVSVAQNAQSLVTEIEHRRQSGNLDSTYVRLLFTALEDLDLAADAPKFFNEARALMPRFHTPLLDADFLYAAGTLARIQNRLGAAIDTLRMALDHYAALGQKAKVALTYSRLGLLYQQQGIYETAIDFHIMALTIAEEISYTDLIFRQNINLASLYNQLNKPHNSLRLLRNAEQIMPANVAAQRHVALFINKADSYARMGRIDSAKASLRRALEITYRTAFKDTAIMAYLYSSYAVIAQRAGQDSLAQSMLDTALVLERSMKPAGYFNIRPLIDASRVMFFRAEQISAAPGILAKKSTEKSTLYRQAIEYAQRAAAIHSNARLYPLWLREIIAKSYAALGEYVMAYQMQRDYITLSDSLFSIGLEKHIEAVKERIARTNREREIERLTSDNRANNRLQYALALVAIVLMALMLVLWNRYRLKQHSEKLVENINTELKDTNTQLTQANYLLNHANNELSLARERAVEVNRMKRAFLDTISHEIRTPLTAIQGYSQLLIMTLTDKEQKEFVERIHASGEHLLLLFEDMLHLSKMQGDQVEIHLQPTSFHELCRQVCAMFEEPARAKGVTLTATVSTALVSHFLLDTAKIRLILFNLVGNAVKFTDKGFVKLTLEPIMSDEKQHSNNTTEIRGICITVQDSGIGIEQEALSSIFESFRQTSVEIHRKYGGLGLGLTLCKSFLDILGGTIRVESEQGKGSTFIVELPIPQAV